MQDPKPGYETTEFWTTIVVSAIGVLLAAGVISPAQASAAQQSAATWAGALVVLATVLTYIVGRVFVKHSAYRAAAIVQSAQPTAGDALAAAAAALADPAAGLLDTPPAPRYGPTTTATIQPPVRVPTASGFTTPANANSASSL